MKTLIQKPSVSSRLLCCALLATAAATGVSAATNSSQSSKTNQSQQSGSNSERSGTQVRVTRATNFLGSDVMSSDGHKVGDIADFYYSVAGTPNLKYVVIQSGGILGYGGDSRAVPAEALSNEGDSVKIQVTQDEFWGVPVLPQDRSRFLKDQTNTQRIAEAFNRSGQSSQNASSNNQNQQSTGQLISFSELRNSDVYANGGNRLGRFVDTWVSLNASRAPYFEVSSPPESPFELLPRNRYAIPMKSLQLPSNEGGDIRVSISEDNVRDSKPISDVEGVKMLESGEIGQQVLRVRLAESAAE